MLFTHLTGRATAFAGFRRMSTNATGVRSTLKPFGDTNAAAARWFAKAAAGSTVAGLALSNFILTEENMKSFSARLKEMGIEMPSILVQAHAFSTPEHGLHAPHYPWDYYALHKSFDHAAIRRGYQVYKEICSACHGMKYVHFRNLVGVSHTEAEAKAIAEEYEYTDGPNDQGEMFQRPGKLADAFPNPYASEEAARLANGGALPPDLSNAVSGRHGEDNYIFSLLTGYCDPPAGVSIREGLHYNPYFPGGAIAMARSLYDEVVEYEDGTPNNASQLAKDVTQFLCWAAYPEHDERKKMGLKTFALVGFMFAMSVWWKRFKWSYIKSRRIVYKPGKFDEV